MFFFHNVREVMTANVRFVFVCFGKRFSRGVPFVRSFVYSLDFLLFLTAGRRHGLLLPAMLNNVPVCFIILLFASSRRVLLVFSIYLLYSSFFVLLVKQRRCSTDSCRFMAQSLRRMGWKKIEQKGFLQIF